MPDRILPVYFLIDTSPSMKGERIELLQRSLERLLSFLRCDPYVLQYLHISIITFDVEARINVPLSDLLMFSLPKLQVKFSPTYLSAGLKLLAQRIDIEITNKTDKEYLKPIVFLILGNNPQDDWQSGLEDLKKLQLGSIFALANSNIDKTILNQITENIIPYDTNNESMFNVFFGWVGPGLTDVIQKVEKVEQNDNIVVILPPPPDNMILI